MSRGHEWHLEPHVCRCCFSRIVSRPADDDDHRRVYHCPNCGMEAEGSRASVLCACGMKVRKGKGSFVDAGVRCHLNADRSPGFPQLYVATVGGAQVDSDS